MTPSIEAVWRLEATRLTGALLRAGADLALAEDCVQDALVAAMQHWPAEGWPERPGAWLMTAAKHCVLGRKRRLGQRVCSTAGPRRGGHRLRQWQRARMPGAPSSATANGRALSALTGGNLDARREGQIWGLEPQMPTGSWRPFADTQCPESVAAKQSLARASRARLT